MSKKKLTLSDLIQKKDQLKRSNDEKKKKELYLEQLDATITIEEPDVTLITESTELANDENYDGNGDEYLVYNVVVEPNLKDKELQKAYGCTEPIDIVRMIFSPGTIYGIAQEAMDLAGMNHKVTTVDKLKN